MHVCMWQSRLQLPSLTDALRCKSQTAREGRDLRPLRKAYYANLVSRKSKMANFREIITKIIQLIKKKKKKKSNMFVPK